MPGSRAAHPSAQPDQGGDRRHDPVAGFAREFVAAAAAAELRIPHAAAGEDEPGGIDPAAPGFRAGDFAVPDQEFPERGPGQDRHAERSAAAQECVEHIRSPHRFREIVKPVRRDGRDSPGREKLPPRSGRIRIERGPDEPERSGKTPRQRFRRQRIGQVALAGTARQQLAPGERQVFGDDDAAPGFGRRDRGRESRRAAAGDQAIAGECLLHENPYFDL